MHRTLTLVTRSFACFLFFFFNDTATTEIYTLSLHDALPICTGSSACRPAGASLSAGPSSPAGTGCRARRRGTRLCERSRPPHTPGLPTAEHPEGDDGPGGAGGGADDRGAAAQRRRAGPGPRD